MDAELWTLLLKTGGPVGCVVAAVAWLFRRGGRISLRFGIDFGGPARSGRNKTAKDEAGYERTET